MNWLSGFWTWIKGWFTSPDKRIEEVQYATVKVCSFLPTALTVSRLLALNSPGLLTAQAIAVAICTAINNQHPSALFGMGKGDNYPKPVVQGVEIEGEFVDK